MARNSWRKKAFLVALIVSIGLAVFLLIKPGDSSVEQVKAEKNVSSTSDVMHFEDMSLQLTGSSHKDTEQVFYFTIENIHNTAISTQSMSFKIKNKGNVYSSKSVSIEDSHLNPGMSTAATVTFSMKDTDLFEGDPLMEIQKGLFFGDVIQLNLEKNH